MLQTWNTQSIRKPYFSQSHYFRVIYWPIFCNLIYVLRLACELSNFICNWRLSKVIYKVIYIFWKKTGYLRFFIMSAISITTMVLAPFLHILASPCYAPGTIAVNVTRLERGSNACKTPRCIYPSIFNRFWDIASYWSKIATFSFSYPTSI